MILKISKGSGFRGTLNYLLQREREPEQEQMVERGRVIGGNMAGRDSRELAAEFSVSRSLRPGVERAVFHASLSLPHGERLSDERWSEVTERFTKEMGFDQSQYVVVKHEDKEHDHVHVVASRIRMDGTVVPDSQDFRRGEGVMRGLERDYGLEQTRSSWEVERAAPTRGEIEWAERTGEPSVKMRLQDVVDRAMEGRPTATQFVERMEAARVEVVPNMQSTGRMSGISFRLDGELMKGSDLGRGYSWQGLEQRGMSYDKERDGAALGRGKEPGAERGDRQPDQERAGGRATASGERGATAGEREVSRSAELSKQAYGEARQAVREAGEALPDIKGVREELARMGERVREAELMREQDYDRGR